MQWFSVLTAFLQLLQLVWISFCLFIIQQEIIILIWEQIYWLIFFSIFRQILWNLHQSTDYSPSAMMNAFRVVRKHVPKAIFLFWCTWDDCMSESKGKVDPWISYQVQFQFSLRKRKQFCRAPKFMASVGYGYNRSEVVGVASEYAVSLWKSDRNHSFSLKWLRIFRGRWSK